MMNDEHREPEVAHSGFVESVDAQGAWLVFGGFLPWDSLRGNLLYQAELLAAKTDTVRVGVGSTTGCTWHAYVTDLAGHRVRGLLHADEGGDYPREQLAWSEARDISARLRERGYMVIIEK